MLFVFGENHTCRLPHGSAIILDYICPVCSRYWVWSKQLNNWALHANVKASDLQVADKQNWEDSIVDERGVLLHTYYEIETQHASTLYAYKRRCLVDNKMQWFCGQSGAEWRQPRQWTEEYFGWTTKEALLKEVQAYFDKMGHKCERVAAQYLICPLCKRKRQVGIEDATKANNSCIRNAADDEPLWVQRAQDKSTPKMVCLWLAENIETISDEKARKALEDALSARRYHTRKAAD